ncbi:MAG: hypothetical protein WCJ46_04920 [bacterium]
MTNTTENHQVQTRSKLYNVLATYKIESRMVSEFDFTVPEKNANKLLICDTIILGDIN